MFLRESLSVNSRSLTYIGLEDFGNEELVRKNSNLKANHGLVFMWQKCIPVISVADLKALINDPENISQRTEKINNLRQKLDTIIEDGCWDLDDILLEHNYSDSTVFECVVYFLAGYIGKRLVARTKCQECIEGLKNLNSTFGPEADLVQAKSKGYLTHPDHNLFIILKRLELCFGKYCRSNDVFEETYNEFFKSYSTIYFPCYLHKNDILTNIFSYYIIMRMRQFTYMDNQNNKKQNRTKKKLSKLVST
ncbi:uncharacterized protein LOC107885562 [Acyrthosiphon pisum]|uniref:Uncharacterized protein n=1 Tax=Acyrthosiphon pisum TaxID=7029 RepID=A0A8R2H9H7_ACYPI|nr:uncharacterized protein LOC107885562 [Acyrthosiphon pisum]|eukprot:XP_016664700.1 PREDICTED: uncharacterized protein LOC107885562 [Acyrthosiphon pisum]